MGSKYADTWAGLAPIAPAAGTRRWVDKLKELGVTHEYVEIPGAGHGDVIGKGMPKIFEFFEKQQKEED